MIGAQNRRRNSLSQLFSKYSSSLKVKTIGQAPLEQLGIQYQGKADIQELQYILGNILTYPSTQLARLHKHANHLGSRDLCSQHQENFTAEERQQLGMKSVFCPCCGFVKQESKIKLCTGLDEINNIGISTYLYFQTLIHLIILLLLITVVYSIFAIVTNVIASDKYQPIEDLDKFRSNVSILSISTGSKILNPNAENQVFYLIQCIIGVALVIIFGAGFVFIKGREKVAEENLDRDTDSAADYSIQMSGVPTSITFQQMQSQIHQYEQSINDVPSYLMVPGFEMAKYNVAKPFYLNQSSFDDEYINDLNQQYDQLINKFTGWIEERRVRPEFSARKERRKEYYDKFRELKKKRFRAYEKKVEQIFREFEKKEKQPTTTVFITFKSSYAKEVFLWKNQQNIISKIRYWLMCCQEEGKFHLLENGEQRNVRIKAAPEPQDIKWENIGYSPTQIGKRKFITNFTTLVLLAISFAIVYGLSSIQKDNKNNSYVSILISFIISIINMILMQVIRYLTLLEKDYTETYHQTSLATKAVVALLLNSIVVPILVNYLLEDGNLYGVEGLAEDIFMLGITNSLLQPLLKIFDAYYYYTRILAWWKNQPSEKMTLNQSELNLYNEYIQFETGYEYIYMVNLFLFICFFTSLQPIMPVFGIFGMILMFWAQKYSIFQRCRRPVPGTTTVNSAMYVLIYLAPMFFCLGNFAWAAFFDNNSDHENNNGFYNTLIPNVIGLVLSFIIFILPFELILYCAFSTQQELQYKYEQKRIYLPSEYDRLNPATSKKAVEEYLDYVDDKRKELESGSPEEIIKFEKKMFRQMQRGKQLQRSNIGINNPLGLALLPQPQKQMNLLVVSQLLLPNTVETFVGKWAGSHDPNFVPGERGIFDQINFNGSEKKFPMKPQGSFPPQNPFGQIQRQLYQNQNFYPPKNPYPSSHQFMNLFNQPTDRPFNSPSSES